MRRMDCGKFEMTLLIGLMVACSGETASPPPAASPAPAPPGATATAAPVAEAGPDPRTHTGSWYYTEATLRALCSGNPDEAPDKTGRSFDGRGGITQSDGWGAVQLVMGSSEPAGDSWQITLDRTQVGGDSAEAHRFQWTEPGQAFLLGPMEADGVLWQRIDADPEDLSADHCPAGMQKAHQAAPSAGPPAGKPAGKKGGKGGKRGKGGKKGR